MQFGTGSPLLGGKSPLEQVMAQSGQGQSAMNQVTPNAATFNPNTQPAQPVPTPQPSPMGAAPQPQQMQTMGNSESQIIIKALTEHLKQLDKAGL